MAARDAQTDLSSGDSSSAGSGSRRAQRHAELRQRIYDAALALFRRQGVANATIREIAREAGVGVGTFFNYFEGKEDVLAALGRQRHERLTTLLADSAMEALSARERIERIMRALIEGMEEEPRLTRAVVRAALGSPTLFHGERARFVALANLFAEILRAGQARGEVAADCDAEVASHLLISIYATLTLDWAEGAEGHADGHDGWSADGNTGYAPLPTLMAHVDALWRGIAPR